MTRKRITIYIDHLDSSLNFEWMRSWLAKWCESVHVAKYSTGGWEHCWDLEAPIEAIAEIPEEWLCTSEWTTSEQHPSMSQ